VSGLPEGRFAGPTQFAQWIRDALESAAQEGWSELVLSDPDFSDWPLGERAVVEALHAWSARGRRCTLLAQRWDEASRRHARFVAWRQRWSHIIDARACAGAGRLELPSALWSPGWVLQRIDLERSIGHAGREAARRLALRESLDEWLGKSSAGFPASTLGL
jgi:hypothetical protein